jgi:hypothetical protein
MSAFYSNLFLTNTPTRILNFTKTLSVRVFVSLCEWKKRVVRRSTEAGAAAAAVSS